jgi:hypothetical protein
MSAEVSFRHDASCLVTDFRLAADNNWREKCPTRAGATRRRFAARRTLRDLCRILTDCSCMTRRRQMLRTAIKTIPNRLAPQWLLTIGPLSRIAWDGLEPIPHSRQGLDSTRYLLPVAKSAVRASGLPKNLATFMANIRCSRHASHFLRHALRGLFRKGRKTLEDRALSRLGFLSSNSSPRNSSTSFFVRAAVHRSALRCIPYALAWAMR